VHLDHTNELNILLALSNKNVFKYSGGFPGEFDTVSMKVTFMLYVG